MEKQKIILIVAVIVLIGVVMGLLGYIIAQNQQSAQSTNNGKNMSAINNTAVTDNTTSSTKHDNYIGKTKAEAIAEADLKEYGVTDYEIRSVDFVTINGVPLYRVNYWDYSILADGTQKGWDEDYVGAIDGKIYDSQGYLVTT